MRGEKVSERNIEIVQSAFDAYLRGDETAMYALTTPDIVVTQFPDQLDGGDFHGQDGARRVMAEWTGTWEDWQIELLDAVEEGQRVFVSARQRGRGKASGAPMETDATFVFTVRDGLISRWQMFHSDEEARRAVKAEG
jgi:ketosteroid isomerase-like protein